MSRWPRTVLFAFAGSMSAIAAASDPAAAYSRQAQQYCQPEFHGCIMKCRVGDTDCGMACADKADKCMEDYDRIHATSIKPDAPKPPKPKGDLGIAPPPAGVKP
ncbi:MAG TPA: hypothetical protein VNJ31_10080 [Methyloceanibacter sp.]|nr:hypothetical protein [Methyloceanibacter sp.]